MNNVKETAQYCLDALKKAGADKVQCSIASAVTNEFNVDGGEFSLFRTLFDDSVSLTAFIGGKKGSITTNRSDTESLDAAVADCIASANSGVADEAFDIAPYCEPRVFTEGAPVIDRDKLFMRTKEFMDTVTRDFPKIVMEQLIVQHTSVKKAYMNSNGVVFETLAGSYNVSAMYSAHEGEKSSSVTGSGVTLDNLDKPFMECSSMRKEFGDISNQIYTKSVDGKFVGTLVLTPSCFNEFLYYICQNFVFDTALINGTSLWKDKLNTKVADERLTFSAAPLDESIVCGERYMSEGFVSENYDVIKNGVLESFMITLYAANKTGFPRERNDSMSFVVAAGDKPMDEMIKGIERGIIVARFSGGNPSSNGDFSGVAKNSFLIENGKITDAVSETMISGNLAQMLLELVGLSSERVADGTTLLPYAAFGGITISGK